MFHRRVTVLLVAWGLVLTACGGADSSDPAGATTSTVAPAGAQGDSGGDEVDPDPAVTDEEAASEPGADPAALDIDLMTPGELPDGIPVPVPAGGVPGGLVAFEGESFAVEFPPGNLSRIGAFYDAWFADQGIAVEPTFGSDELQLWRVNINGVPVEIELYKLTNADDERLFITWP
jgi:hypothetical protein